MQMTFPVMVAFVWEVEMYTGISWCVKKKKLEFSFFLNTNTGLYKIIMILKYDILNIITKKKKGSNIGEECKKTRTCLENYMRKKINDCSLTMKGR